MFRVPCSTFSSWFVCCFVLCIITSGVSSTVQQHTNTNAESIAIRLLTSAFPVVYELMELEIVVPNIDTYTNPFDPEEIAVSLYMRNVGKQSFVVDGFYYQNYTRRLNASHLEELTPNGSPTFLVRFTPVIASSWEMYANVTTAKSTSLSSRMQVKTYASRPGVIPKGVIQVGPNQKNFIDSASKRTFYGVGENMCWAESNTTYMYDRWLHSLAGNQGNYIRLWLGPFDSFTLEDPSTGVGRYNLDSLYRLDYVLQLAASLGIRVMMCLNSFNSIRSIEPYGWFRDSPYNVQNGGMLHKPIEYFTNTEAIAYWRRRFRYINARFGYSADVLSWELWNEVDLGDDFIFHINTVKEWHISQATYIRSLDIYGHMITTSFAFTPGVPFIDAIPQLDYIQTHSYGPHNYGLVVPIVTWLKTGIYHKPTYLGEGGIGTKDFDTDVNGVALHNILWSSIVSGAACTGMTWWWDLYVDPKNLYYHFHAPAKFVALVEFAYYDWKPLNWTLPAAYSSSLHVLDSSNSQDNLSLLDSLGLGNMDDDGVSIGGSEREYDVFGMIGMNLHFNKTSDYEEKKDIFREAIDMGPETIVMLWIQSHNYTWYKQSRLDPPAPLYSIPSHNISISAVPLASYLVTSFDTVSGDIISNSTIPVSSSAQGELRVPVPSFRTDVALLMTSI